MKNVIKSLIALSVLSSVSVNAAVAITASDTDTTSFVIGGEIESACKVTSDQASGAETLNLASSTSQSAALVNVWCNGGGETTQTTYTSANDGYLVDGDNKIQYLLDLDGSAVDFSSPVTVAQSSGAGTDGTPETTEVKVQPSITGLEAAGTYSDTITVTVAAQ